MASILLVDSNLETRGKVQAALGAAGHTVTLAIGLSDMAVILGGHGEKSFGAAVVADRGDFTPAVVRLLDTNGIKTAVYSQRNMQGFVGRHGVVSTAQEWAIDSIVDAAATAVEATARGKTAQVE